MKLMGMKGWIYWASSYSWYSIYVLILVSLSTLILHIKIGNAAVITHTDPSITFVFLLLFAFANMTLCFVVTTLFSKGNLL